MDPSGRYREQADGQSSSAALLVAAEAATSPLPAVVSSRRRGLAAPVSFPVQTFLDGEFSLQSWGSIPTCEYSCRVFRPAPYHAPVAVIAAKDPVKAYMRNLFGGAAAIVSRAENAWYTPHVLYSSTASSRGGSKRSCRDGRRQSILLCKRDLPGLEYQVRRVTSEGKQTSRFLLIKHNI